MLLYKVESVDYLDDSEVFSANYENCSPLRKSKIDKLVFLKDKKLSLGVEVLFKKLLIENNIFSSDEIPPVKISERGKPFFDTDNTDRKIFFNMSHSGEKIMCAVSDSLVGCDIEKISWSREECITIAKRFFNEAEYNFLQALDAEQVPVEFYKLWTAKEAFAKCYDLPLSDILSKDISGEDSKIITQVEKEYVYSISLSP